MRWLLSLAWLFAVAEGKLGKLGIVRAFANANEVNDMPEMFGIWNTVPPCESPVGVTVDVILVYSQSFEDNPAAQQAAQNVITSFESGTAWSSCFGSVRAFDAKLTAQEDVYDARGYAARNDWANGPNTVFLFVMRSFRDGTFGNYDAFYFMEFDAVPVRDNWLHQFVAEAYDATVAIRGSRYRGDTWDPYLSSLPADVLFHVNGNAIYNLTHPWLISMVQTLDAELLLGTLSSAFDIRMAQLMLQQYSAADPAIPYKGDSVLIGNYAQTLLNSSFEAPEFIRHAALSNFFQNVADSDVTLGVLANSEMSSFMASLASTHPFRTVLVASDGSYDLASSPVTVSSSQGVTATVTSFALEAGWVTSYCEIAQRVQTKFVAFSDALSVVQAPVYILVNDQGEPLLPYIPADSYYCTRLPSCTSELEEAELLFGVKLNYHHNTFDTIFETAQFLRFCSAYRLAISDLQSYDDCGIVNGITADSFIAWLISMSSSEAFNYVPKNKQRYGQRGWERLSNAHPIDTRSCSVYKEEERALIGGNITTWSCLLIIEDPARCDATEGCSWRPMFGSGRCVNTPQQVTFDFLWRPTFTATTTFTRTITTSRTTSATTSSTTASISSTTRTSTGTTRTATSTGTSSTVTTITSITQTATTVTFTVQVPCAPETLPEGYEAQSCDGLVSGQSCTVECLPPLLGNAQYFCNEAGIFEGEAPVCVTRSCSFAEEVPSFYVSSSCANVTAGGFCFVACPEMYDGLETIFFCGPDWTLRGILPVCQRIECYTGSLPVVEGANVTDCLRGADGQPVGAGQSCQVSCNHGFSGTTETMNCLESGIFEGQAVTCARKQCSITWSNADLELDCRSGFTVNTAAVHGDVCVAYCVQGFSGPSTEMKCEDGSFQGFLPSCVPAICSWQGFQLLTNVDNRDCNDVQLGSTCTLKCHSGYTAIGNPLVLCQTNYLFSEPQLSCEPESCGDLSLVEGFDATVGHSCAGAKYSELCSAFCLDGYELSGSTSQLVCSAASSNSGFTSLTGGAPQPPTCIPLPCTSGFPTTKGAVHNCTGARTGDICIVEAEAGYDAVPSRSILECLPDGTISGTEPVISSALCGTPSFPTGVGSTCENKVVGAECWAYCERNYLGDARRYFCQVGTSGASELVPDSVAVSCTPDPGRRLLDDERRLTTGCDATSVQAFGLSDEQYVHSCDNILHDGVCLSHCNLGWEMTVGPSVLVCNTGALVGSALPQCQVQHDCEGKVTLETCSGSCQLGYTGTPSSYQCSSSGNFEGSDPTCEPLTCSPPQLAARYAHDCTGITLGKSCTVDCAQGYELDGGLSRLRCSIDGSFQGDLPSCSPVQCANTVPKDPAFEKTPCDGLIYQGQCDVTCNPGFQANTTTLSCNSQGALIGTLPLCQFLPCDGSHLDRPEWLNTCGGVVNGQNCSVFCARGYEAAAGAGLEQLSCIFTGSSVELLGQLPSCTASPCTEGLPLPSDRATNNCSELFFQEKCIENCIEGYTGTTPHFVCASDGTATRDSNSFCRPEECDSKVLPSLLLHTCENVSFGENCYAYCPPGYVAEALATRLRCLGPSSSEPAVSPSEEDSVTLRGTVPQCVASQCLYNLPWGERYVHNCSAVVTGQHCLVSCAEGWFGTVEVLTCQATGDLSGAYPACRTITQTTTRTFTVTQPEPVVVKGSGGYLVAWSQQNASQEHPIASLAVEQSLRWLLNVTGLDVEDAALVSASVEELNGTEDAADILFEIELPTQNATTLLAQLVEVFEEKQHVFAVQAALRNTGLDSLWNASILEFFVNFSVEDENLTADLAYVVPPQIFAQAAPLEELPAEYLTLIIAASVIVCLCCTVAIYIVRYFGGFSAKEEPEVEVPVSSSAGVMPDGKAVISGSQVMIREPPEEDAPISVPSSLKLPIQNKSSKPKDEALEGLCDNLEELGINFDSEDEGFLEVGIVFTEDGYGGVSGPSELEEEGVIFDQGNALRDHEDRLFESEGSESEPPPVRLEVMDTSQHPPRIIAGERQTLQDAGILFNTKATQATDWRSEVSSRAPRRERQTLQNAGILFNTEGTQATQADWRSEVSSRAPRRERQTLQDAGILFNTEGTQATQATDLRSEASSKDHFAL